MDHVIPQLLMLVAVLAVGLLAGAVLVIYLLTLLRLAVREQQHRNVAWRREGVRRVEIRVSQLTQSMASSTDAARKPKVQVSGR